MRPELEDALRETRRVAEDQKLVAAMSLIGPALDSLHATREQGSRAESFEATLLEAVFCTDREYQWDFELLAIAVSRVIGTRSQKTVRRGLVAFLRRMADELESEAESQ